MAGTLRVRGISRDGTFKPSADAYAIRRWLGVVRSHPVLLGVAFLFALTLTQTLLTAHTNADSQAYHLARVWQWAERGSIAFYPALIERQLYQPPLTSYIMLHLYLLAGSDLPLALVQWGAYVGCVVGTAGIARRIGATRQQQVYALILAATLWTVVLQASSTQNALVLALWFVALVTFILDDRWFYVGVTAGLALLTKGTALVLLPPFLLWFAWRKRKRFMRVIAAGLIAALIMTPHWARNVAWYGSPFGGETDMYANEAMSPALLISNITRNVGLHVSLDLEPLHAALGVALNDPRISWFPETHPYWGVWLYPNEDVSPSPFHVALALFAFIPALIAKRTRALTLCVLAAFILFCAVFKWQTWHARLHLPILVLFAPLTVIGLRALPKVFWQALIVVLLVTAGAWGVINVRAPLWGENSILVLSREQQYANEFAKFNLSCAGEMNADAEYLYRVVCR